jgi:hypothetical protein
MHSARAQCAATEITPLRGDGSNVGEPFDERREE